MFYYYNENRVFVYQRLYVNSSYLKLIANYSACAALLESLYEDTINAYG